jgi:two-component system response regulator RstA
VVLVLANRPSLVSRIKTALNHSAFTAPAVSTIADDANGVADWHLAIVDVDFGGAQVMALLGHKRLSGKRVPVIGLTHRADLHTRQAAYDAGMDDILIVPFAPEVLRARVNAIVRRTYSEAVTFTPVIKLGELEIDILTRTVRVGNSALHLTSSERSLLYFLAANAGRVVSRDEILNTLWGMDYLAESNVVDRQIRNLRARLNDDWRNPRFIATVQGRGYRFLATSRENGAVGRAA